MNIKIGLITVHHAYNYGAMLQAYATYIALKRLDCDVEFIDYDNTTFKKERSIFLPNKSIGDILRNMRNLMHLSKQKMRIVRFEEFYSMLPKSKRYWLNNYDFSDTEYDCIMVGSDQTFCLKLTGNPEDMRGFFLQHTGKAKRLSYASSMGEKCSELTKEDDVWLSTCFRKFDSLLVRDEKSADYIFRLIGEKPKVVIDPTLLLSMKDWDAMISKEEKQMGEYIAFYTVLSGEWVVRFTKKISEYLGLKVIALHPTNRFDMKSNFIFKSDCGPKEFISVIKNAKYVITTSFHATVFSIIYHKKFMSLLVGEGNRISSLLNSLGIEKRSIRDGKEYSCSLIDEGIDYNEVDKKLERLRKYSIDCLNNSLEEVMK